jgi:hypothetical protein
MPAALRIILTQEEDQTLRELRLAQTVPQRTRDRAHILRLNPYSASWGAIKTIRKMGQREDNSGDKRD